MLALSTATGVGTRSVCLWTAALGAAIHRYWALGGRVMEQKHLLSPCFMGLLRRGGPGVEGIRFIGKVGQKEIASVCWKRRYFLII